MTTIASLNYRIGADTSEFVKGATIAKKEVQALNRIFGENATEAEKVSKKLNTLDEAYRAGQITREAFAKAESRIREATTEAKEAQRQANEMAQKALQIREAQKTAEQKYAEALEKTKRELVAMTQAGKLSRQESAEALRRFKMGDPAELKRQADEAARISANAQMAADMAAKRAAARAAMTSQLTSFGMAVPGGATITSIATAAGPIAAAGVGLVALTAGFYSAARAAQAFNQMMTEQRKKIDDANDAALNMGMSLEQLQGLQAAALFGAGISADAATAAFQKLQIEIGKAASAEVEDKTFARLKLDAKELAAMQPQEAIYKIADAMAAVENPAERARISVELFGKGNVAMGRALAQGADQMRKSQEEARRLGAVLSEVDAAMVAAANDEMDRLAMATDGIRNALAVEFAPAVQVVAQELTAFLASFNAGGNGTRDLLADIAAMTLYVGGVTKDTAAVILNAYEIALAAASGRIGDVTKNALELKAAFMLPSGANLVRQYELARVEAEKAAAAAKAEREASKEIAGSKDPAAEAAAKRAKEAESSLEGMRKRLAMLKDERTAIGLTSEQWAEYRDIQEQITQIEANKKADEQIRSLQAETNPMAEIELLRQQGVTEERIKQLELLRQQKELQDRDAELVKKAADDFAKKQEEAKQKADQLVASLRSPLDVIQDEIDSYAKLLREGLITQQQFDRASAKMVNDQIRTQGPPRAVEFGSTEAYKVLAELNNDTKNRELKAEMTREAQRKAMERTATASEKQVKLLEDIQLNTV